MSGWESIATAHSMTARVSEVEAEPGRAPADLRQPLAHDDWATYLAGETLEAEAAPSRRRTSADPRAPADNRCREPSAARTINPLSPALAHQIQRPRNVSASVP